MANSNKVPAGTPDSENPEVVEQAAKDQKASEEAQAKAAQGPATKFKSAEDAEKDLAKKQQAFTEAQTELAAAEQGYEAYKVAAQQAKVDELKEQGVEYDDQGRELGIQGTPVSNPLMYGGNPAPNVLGKVHA